jgi:hypothetical protein
MSYDPSFKTNFVEGVNRFQNARFKAFWEEAFALLRGKSTDLLSFDDIRTRLRLSDESYKGLQNIDIDKIAGSVGRYRDFTSNFMPRRSKMQERWSRVYAVANSMEGLPPIEVYQVGDVYFVRDGNHRVSVAHQLKMKTIEAHVTELRSPISLRPNISNEELDDAAAYAAFLAETQLNTIRPHHQPMQLSEPDRYGEMMEMIYRHRDILQGIEAKDVPLREAAAHWYDNVYRPAVTLIRKYGVLESLPKRKNGNPRTESDLFLWMVSHLYEMRQHDGETETRGYGEALADFMSEKDMSVPEDLTTRDNADALITETQVMRSLHRYDYHGPFSGDNVHTRVYEG